MREAAAAAFRRAPRGAGEAPVPGTARSRPLPPAELARRVGAAAGGGAAAPGTKTPPGRTTYFRGRPRRSGGAAGAQTRSALPAPLPGAAKRSTCRKTNKIKTKLKQHRKGKAARRGEKPRARRWALEGGPRTANTAPPRGLGAAAPSGGWRGGRSGRRAAGSERRAAAAPPGTPTPAPAG